jgi:hypothetical protein
MDSYLQNYGAGEEQRNRKIKWLVISFIAVLLISWFSYLFVHNFFEVRTAKHFLAEVNAGRYQQAYHDWGCTDATPCPNYGFNRFLEDWGPNSKVTPPWKVTSVDGCTAFVTVNVGAKGSDVQSIGVERGSKTLMYAPGPECNEKQWRWKAFFKRIFGRSGSATS